MEVNLHVTAGKKAGEGLQHARLSVLLHVSLAMLCYSSTLGSYLVFPLTNNTMQIFCLWGHLGAIKQCMGKVHT